MSTVVQVELSEGSWSCASETVAFEAVAAVSGDAGEFTVVVVAAGSPPDATGPVGVWRKERTVGVGRESEATFLQDRVACVGLNGWPDGEGTVVNDGEEETAGVCGGGEGDEEEEERGGERKSSFSHFLLLLALYLCEMNIATCVYV